LFFFLIFFFLKKTGPTNFGEYLNAYIDNFKIKKIQAEEIIISYLKRDKKHEKKSYTRKYDQRNDEKILDPIKIILEVFSKKNLIDFNYLRRNHKKNLFQEIFLNDFILFEYILVNLKIENLELFSLKNNLNENFFHFLFRKTKKNLKGKKNLINSLKILEKNYQISLNFQDINGNTPLMILSSNPFLNFLFPHLINFSTFDVSLSNSMGLNLFHFLAFNSNNFKNLSLFLRVLEHPTCEKLFFFFNSFFF
jgi:hypothetical protein